MGRGLPMYSRERTRLTPRGVKDDASRILGSQGLQERPGDQGASFNMTSAFGRSDLISSCGLVNEQ